MDAELKPKQEVWRGRGHPGRQVPEEVRRLADGTYGTGRVGVVVYTEEEAANARELRLMLISYANSIGRRMRIQTDEGINHHELRFMMVDRRQRRNRESDAA